MQPTLQQVLVTLPATLLVAGDGTTCLLSHAEAGALYASTPGDSKTKQLAVRGWVAQQLLGTLGPAFLPSPESPLVQLVHFEPPRFHVFCTVGAE